mgnify:FL=1
MGGALSSPAVLVRSTKFMIILKKETHYCHVDSREKAQKLVNDGYEVIKNRLGLPKIVKQEVKKPEPKKKMFKKK